MNSTSSCTAQPDSSGKLTAEYLARAGGDGADRAGRPVARPPAGGPRHARRSRRSPGRCSPPTRRHRRRWTRWRQRTRVVITTVGPVQPLRPAAGGGLRGGGHRLRRSHRRAATFVRESIDLYHKQAVDTGARIVHSCGFDSIPSDLTVFALYRRAQQDDAGELGRHQLGGAHDVRAACRAARSRRWSKSDRAVLQRPDARRNDERPLHADRRTAARNPNSARSPTCAWRRGARDRARAARPSGPAAFVMALANTRIVRRSNALLDYGLRSPVRVRGNR